MKKRDYCIAFLPEYPLSLMKGGLEIQCINTKQALLNKNINVKDFSFWDTTIDYDVLHIFGNPAYLSDIVSLAKKKISIVISTTMGCQGKLKIRHQASNLLRHIPIHTDTRRFIQMLNDADALITVNEMEQKNLVDNFKINPSKVHIVRNGVNKRFLNSSPEVFEDKYKIRDFCLCVGSICRRKNQINLVRALIDINLPGVFIGSPMPGEVTYLNEFKRLVSKSDLFLWIPQIEHNDPLLPSAYAACKLVCLPSFAETQSLVALEACASNKPVILGNRPYAFQEPFGNTLKCDPNSVDSITKKISMVIKDPHQFVTNISDEYRWDKIADKIIKIYSKLV